MVMNGKKNIVPIVMASDENYLFPTSVAMVSIMENGNEENEYIFYLLVKPELVGMVRIVFCNQRKIFKFYMPVFNSANRNF